MKKYILTIFLLLIFHLPAYGSSIIVMRNDNEIIIGTDSKRVYAAKEGMNNAASELTCKIVMKDNLFITSAGIVGISPYGQREKIPDDFDLTKIMSNAALGEGSVMDKADALAKALNDALLRMCVWMRNKMPAFFGKKILGRQALQVIVAGMESWTPTIIVMSFEPNILPSGELNINFESRPCPGVACPSGFTYIFMGRHEAIDRYLSENPGTLRNDPVDVVRALIEIEVASDPETVGPPIDILRIAKEGSEWIQEKNICEDISRSGKTPYHYP